jgi:hypothetical protein
MINRCRLGAMLSLLRMGNMLNSPEGFEPYLLPIITGRMSLRSDRTDVAEKSVTGCWTSFRRPLSFRTERKTATPKRKRGGQKWVLISSTMIVSTAVLVLTSVPLRRSVREKILM